MSLSLREFCGDRPLLLSIGFNPAGCLDQSRLTPAASLDSLGAVPMILATNRRAILILCLLSFPLGAIAAAQKETADLQQMMSADEFKAAGLEKLSPEELQNLNKFLQGFPTEKRDCSATRCELQVRWSST